MNNHPILSFIKTTLIGGLFFLVPIAVLIFALEQIIVAFRYAVDPLAKLIPLESIGGIRMSRIIAVAFLILVCFFIGLFSDTKFANKIIDWLEDNVLAVIPGYSFLKGMGETLAGVSSDKLKDVVVVDIEEVWQIGFLVENLGDGLSAVYIPGAPNPLAGDVVIVHKSRYRPIDLKPMQAMRISSKLGVGSKQFLEGSVSSDMFGKSY